MNLKWHKTIQYTQKNQQKSFVAIVKNIMYNLLSGGIDMNNSYIATAVAIRDLNCYSLETINDRILLQKKIYLAQDIGLPLGYGYSWYIHGPYSTDLTAVAYQIIPEGKTSIENNTLKEPYAKIIDRVNLLEDIIGEQNLKISVVQWYELIASIAYWYNCGYKTQQAATEKIHETKPQFTEDQIQAGYSAYVAFKTAA